MRCSMPRFDAFSLSVPATSANLGPGFDAVGLALGLRVRAQAAPARRFTLDFVAGPNAPTHDGYRDAMLAAMLRVSPELPRARIIVNNAIPLGKGLGSSAAAAVLGIAIAARAAGIELSRNDIAQHVCAIEGHPDNALPAVFGGAVIAASGDARSFVRVRTMGALRAVLLVPDCALSTEQARALLPERYDRCDVVFTAQRAALLGAALASGEWGALREAMRDRVHQPYRAPHIPGLAQALDIRSRSLLGVALSGAGPSVIAMLRRGAAWEGIAARIAGCFEAAGVAVQTLPLALGVRGLAYGPGA